MERTQQIASVLAICASILLAGMVIAYKPGEVAATPEFRFPTGVSAGTTSYPNIAVTNDSSAPKTLSVSGSGVVNVKANQATVILGVYTEDKSASTAIDDNAATMTPYCKRAVEAHGGSLSFDTRLGEGTTFTIIIPDEPHGG